MSTGRQIKKYRKLRGLTQRGLAEKAGFTESGIRNYERDYRTPNEYQLIEIAKGLDVPVSALQDYEINSAREALEALFRLEDAFGIKPTEDGVLAIDPKAEGAKKLTMAIKAWKGALDELEAGEMTEEEYELWRASLRD